MSPNMPTASTSAVEPAQTAVMHPHRMAGSSASPAYRMPSPQASVRGEPPYPAPLAVAPRSPQAPYRIPAVYSQPRPPLAMPSPPITHRVPSPSPPLTSSSRLPETRLPPSRRASLSLAAITSPYLPEPAPYNQAQPKNHRAQTQLLLGQRLRKASAPTGPAEGHRRRAHHNCCIVMLPAKVAPKWKRSLPNRRRRHRLPRATLRKLYSHQRHFLCNNSKVAITANHTVTLVVNSRSLSCSSYDEGRGGYSV